MDNLKIDVKHVLVSVTVVVPLLADVFKVVPTGCCKLAVNFSARTHDHSPPSLLATTVHDSGLGACIDLQLD